MAETAKRGGITVEGSDGTEGRADDARAGRAAVLPPYGGHQDLFYARDTTVGLPTVVRGEGIYLWDDLGNRYIDVCAGAFLLHLGQGNERVLRAMSAQGRELTFSYVRNTRHDPNFLLTERIARLAGPGFERCHLSSGGSESMEMAIKFLRQYALATGHADKTRVISCMPSYHGATLGTIALTGAAEYEPLYADMVTFSSKVPAPLTYRLGAEQAAARTLHSLEQEIVRLGPERVLAFVIEPIGGMASGANVPPDSFFPALRSLCDRYGVYLVFDEILSACRTGHFLAAHRHPDALPDVVVLAKGLGAGYVPVGAMLAPARMVDELAELTGFNLSHTYNANPIVCAGASAVIDEIMERGLVSQARILGERLVQRLDQLAERSPIIGDVRGLGLLYAIELVADKAAKAPPPSELRVSDRLRILGLRHGLLLYARVQNEGRFGEWTCLAPPLTITEGELDDLVDRLEQTIDDLALELRELGVLA
jgi:adenosylmethionine-8-amino-7-oxononanoate aminotransferase